MKNTNSKIYGPYRRPDGRQHVIIINNGKRRTVSYPKWLMEQELGRELHPYLETIDHIDGNFTNNDLSNLRVIERKQHINEDRKRVKAVVTACIGCKTELIRSASQLNRNARLGKAGPFCKPCAGTYGANLQNGRTDRLNPQPEVVPEYFTLKSKK